MIVSRGFVPDLALSRGLPAPVRYHGYPRVAPPTMTSLQWRVQRRLQGHSGPRESRPSHDGEQINPAGSPLTHLHI